MEKKVSARQSTGQNRNGSVSSEKKSDFPPSRHGRGRGRRTHSGTSKTPDAAYTPRASPVSKMDRLLSDSRQRQRFCYDYRQREEVVESDDAFDVLSFGSRKGNANHLLNYNFCPRPSQRNEHRWYDRSSFNFYGQRRSRKSSCYKQERFLQASCQFVVQDTGDYTEQAINSDALVDWNMIELVRIFSTEPANCPICLEVPYAGKITKCGHTFCWACILHHLKTGEKEACICPLCNNIVESEELKSVQWIFVPDFKVGDEIEMKLMRKAKGSVFTIPKDEWEDRQGKPMNVGDGPNTKYMKLLVASCDQIQSDVIEIERLSLTQLLADAEDAEICFIEMALQLLAVRESSLKTVFLESLRKRNKINIPGLSSSEAYKTESLCQVVGDTSPKTTATVYADTFDEIMVDPGEKNVEAHAVVEKEINSAGEGMESSESFSVEEDGSKFNHDESDSSFLFDSPHVPIPLKTDQEVNSLPLSIEETHDHLELPVDIPDFGSKQFRRNLCLNSKDTYFFYQASTGQHIYLNSLNAQCLSMEYGSLENSPSTIKATIVATERISMKEDVRKRLRYLDHIPLSSEFRVVELKIKPPVVSKATLKHFEAAFEEKRKLRRQREKEDKKRAAKSELEQRKSLGFYPEVQIPLDNLNQFPSHLTGDSPPLAAVGESEAAKNDTLAGEAASNLHRSRNNSTTSDDSHNGSVSFAQMLRTGKGLSQPGSAWGKKSQHQGLPPSSTFVSRPRQGNGEDSDGEDLPAPSYGQTMSNAIAIALDNMNLRRQPSGEDAPEESKAGGGKKKKKKEKQTRKERQILFSTSMAGKS